MLHLILIGIVSVLFYYYAITPKCYWKDRSIVQGNPVWLFGDQWKQFFRLETYPEFVQKFYDLAQDKRYSGLYQFSSPTLLIKDPDLIKKLTVKDFNHFMNHREFIPEGADPYWSKNLLSLKDKKWKEIRPIISPTFTSSNMKIMFTLMTDCSENLVNHFLMKNKKIIEINVKDLTTRFANDIIASTAFGIQTDSLEKPTNEFYLMGKRLTNFTTFWVNLKLLGFIILPKLLKFFNVHLFDGISRKYFGDILKQTLMMREEFKIVRPDMIHLLLEAKNKEKENYAGKFSKSAQQITNDDIIAQALIFFFAGFDSVSSLMSFMSYELAINPKIQQRAREEIDEGFERCNDQLTYETVIGMKYLNMIISETLRKWPTFPSADRQCSKNYTITPENASEKALIVEKGVVLLLPIMSLHYDPKYFPDPQRFDPERFNETNKADINPYTYFPFGLGPRTCIGSRFALLETKVFFAYLLHHFEIIPTSKSTIPVKLSKKYFNLHAADGMQFGLKRLK